MDFKASSSARAAKRSVPPAGLLPAQLPGCAVCGDGGAQCRNLLVDCLHAVAVRSVSAQELGTRRFECQDLGRYHTPGGLVLRLRPLQEGDASLLLCQSGPCTGELGKEFKEPVLEFRLLAGESTRLFAHPAELRLRGG